MSEIIVNHQDLIYLLYCSVNDCTPDASFTEKADFTALLKACTAHKISAFADKAVQRSGADETIKNAFQKEKLNAIRINILFFSETEKITKELENNGIWYMHIKGKTIAQYYPESLLRQTGDVDILFDAGTADKVMNIMTKMGYHTDHFGKSHHDTYEKPPFFTIEMHRTLFSALSQQNHEYYNDVKDKLLPVDGKKFEYKFRDDDLYIYYIAHGINHLRHNGTGIRTLLDIYFMLQKANLDFTYIDKELSVLGIAEEEMILRSLAQKLFSPENGGDTDTLDENEKKMLDSLIRFGVYGTIENKIRKNFKTISMPKVNTRSKIKYVLWRIFSVPEEYKIRTPKLYKHRITKPLIFFVRVHNGLTVRRKKIISEWKTLRRMK